VNWRFWRRRPDAFVCRDAVALMTAYLDGDLTPGDRTRLEEHLDACPHCHEYLAQLRVVIDASGHVGPDDLDDDTLDELVALYRAWRSN
jgi:anti-sigma factor RsiW